MMTEKCNDTARSLKEQKDKNVKRKKGKYSSKTQTNRLEEKLKPRLRTELKHRPVGIQVEAEKAKTSTCAVCRNNQEKQGFGIQSKVEAPVEETAYTELHVEAPKAEGQPMAEARKTTIPSKKVQI